MTKSPSITGKELIIALKKFGFEIIKIKGSHYFLRHGDGRCAPIPVHSGEILGPGICSKILHDCEITNDDLRKLI